MSAPWVASSWTWISVALTSSVLVVVIDWIEIGAFPPTATDPTLTCLVLRRSFIANQSMAAVPLVEALEGNADWARQIQVEDCEEQQHEERDHCRGHWDQLAQVDAPPRDRFVGDHRQVPSVERWERQEVHQSHEDGEANHESDEVEVVTARNRLPGDPPGADYSERSLIHGPLARAGQGIPQSSVEDHPEYLADSLDGSLRHVPSEETRVGDCSRKRLGFELRLG